MEGREYGVVEDKRGSGASSECPAGVSGDGRAAVGEEYGEQGGLGRMEVIRDRRLWREEPESRRGKRSPENSFIEGRAVEGRKEPARCWEDDATALVISWEDGVQGEGASSMVAGRL